MYRWPPHTNCGLRDIGRRHRFCLGHTGSTRLDKDQLDRPILQPTENIDRIERLVHVAFFKIRLERGLFKRGLSNEKCKRGLFRVEQGLFCVERGLFCLDHGIFCLHRVIVGREEWVGAAVGPLPAPDRHLELILIRTPAEREDVADVHFLNRDKLGSLVCTVEGVIEFAKHFHAFDWPTGRAKH
eukprot:scaffold20920_cov67-Phaeocystis_antarctica.AAC.2